jgi:tetratricopeptide (TPR) repeat protein
MTLDSLAAELEQLLTLKELTTLSESALGLDPGSVGGGAARASFARALLRRCSELEAVPALLDAIEATGKRLPDNLHKLRSDGLVLEPALEPGSELGEFTILEELGAGPSARVYRARRGDELVRLRVLRSIVRRQDAERALVHARLCSAIAHAGLPDGVSSGKSTHEGKVLAYVSHDYVIGVTLAELLERDGPLHLNAALPLLWSIAEPLATLHAEDRVHGALHAGNVLVLDERESTPRVRLLDAGAGLSRPPLTESGQERWVSALAPELVRGKPATAASDVYAFGALFYELLAGRAPYAGQSAADIALGHLIEAPESLAFVAPGNGATPAVETLVGALLEKNAAARPQNGTELLEGLRRLWHASQRPPSFIAEERLPEMFESLAQNPQDDAAAARLEAMLDLGADPALLADGFVSVAKQLRAQDERSSRRCMPKLLARAARLYEKAARPESAEKLYKGILKLEPEDRATAKALDKLQRSLGKHEELIESLLERSERAQSPAERGEYLLWIAEVYASDLGDREQALVAYTQAFCADPSADRYAEAVERLAGSRFQAWEEVLSTCLEAAAGELSLEAQHDLFSRMAEWYAERVSRPDLALPWLKRVLDIEPGHERSLSSLTQIYRRAQQWPELSQALLKQADVAAPNLARELRAEAAEVLLSKLNQVKVARELFESVIAEDPGHERAANGLVALLREAGEARRALEVQEGRAATLSGGQRHELLCELAEAYEIELDALEAAERAYRTVLSEDARSQAALRGLDRIYSRQGRYQEVLGILERQIELAVTPRQKITLLERVAAVCDEEFLDHARAARALESVLELDAARGDTAQKLARHYRALERFDDLAELFATQLGSSDDPARRLEAALALGSVLATELAQPERAIRAYEAALRIEPGHRRALDALANLRADSGDSESALSAIEALAGAAKTAAERAQQHQRAAALLQQRGDLDGAIAQLKRAIDAFPDDSAARSKLRALYLELGNHAGLVELLEEELDRAQGDRSRAKLAGEIALLCQRRLADAERASAMAQLAFHLDPTEPAALRVLGRLAFDEGRYVEAAKRLEPVLSLLETLEQSEAAELSRLYVQALIESGATEKALVMVDGLRRFFADDASTLLAIAELAVKNEAPEQAHALARELLESRGRALSGAELALAERICGQALLALGQHEQAIAAFDRALVAEPLELSPLDGIAKAHLARGRYDQALETLYRKLEHSTGEDRTKLLLQIGDLAATRLNDPDYAGKSYLLALSEKPNDRDILAKLMQLYGSEKDWPRLIQVITKLAEVVDDKKHKAKYLHTASMIASRELSDAALAEQLLEQSLKFDSSYLPALDEAVVLQQRAQDWNAVKNLLKLRVDQAQAAGDSELLLTTLWQLADVYEQKLGRMEQAIAVCASAHQLEPDNTRWSERLARLYARDPSGSFAEAVPLIGEWIERDPYQTEPYKLLRRIYTGVRHADGAWSACQALHVLGRSDPDEERFYERLRADEPLPISERLALSEWPEYILPPEHDATVTALMTLLEPLVLTARGKPLEAYGLGPEHLLSADTYPYGLVLALSTSGRALGIPAPRVYQNQSDPGVLAFLATVPASIALGASAFASELPSVTTQFLAARSLCYFVPGFFVRQVLGNMTALKSWVFAAIRVVKPRFPVAVELEPLVNQASRELLSVSPSARQQELLTDVVSKLLRGSEALDLKRWVQSVDFAADRAGLVMCQDLEHAVSLIKSLPAQESSPASNVRVERLVAYSVSTAHLTLRERLGLSVGG